MVNRMSVSHNLLFSDVKDLIASLGESMDLLPSSTQATPSLDGSAMTRAVRLRVRLTRKLSSTSFRVTAQASRRRAMTNTSALADITKELLTTERSYVKKLRILKTEYADPLRNFSKNKNTAILGTYEAKAIFGNVDQLLPVNEAFLADLERMEENGLGVGDVALKHFRDLQGFETYKTYFSKHEEVQKLFEHEVKKNSRFSEFIEVSPICARLPSPHTVSLPDSVSNTPQPQIRGIGLACGRYSQSPGNASPDTRSCSIPCSSIWP